MSMFDNLKSKLGIDTEADSYIDDTEDEIFAGGQGAAQQDYYTAGGQTAQQQGGQHQRYHPAAGRAGQAGAFRGRFHHRGPAQRQAHRRV